MKLFYLLLGSLFCISFSAQAEVPNNPDFIKAEKIYKRSCATCHGKKGKRAAMGESKIINQLKTEDISTALFERKKGNVIGAGNPAKQRLTEEEIKALSEFVPTLK
ncbi:c-type cytochrome [Rodentibacter pneumotropicus]|uniref:c-type cytochrome n=1 Tax=Rodentibacter pneumotropicus TaxID=758 RepID=UPI000984E979|nr:c-type cytochrome [Rodentibacter pneumotropicus]OOF62337.1 cytochrome C biogenesis protein CcsB [Rodentibacter pneumotropicus]THA17589.1 cytochrome C biogenesis protein CcsB [Rodentibacter pneumotropicus]